MERGIFKIIISFIHTTYDSLSYKLVASGGRWRRSVREAFLSIQTKFIELEANILHLVARSVSLTYDMADFVKSMIFPCAWTGSHKFVTRNAPEPKYLMCKYRRLHI